jgi:hypothetical protein
MRMNIMFGLNHVEAQDREAEAGRLLSVLTEKLALSETTLKEGDAFILRDINGNRVGVADVFKD